MRVSGGLIFSYTGSFHKAADCWPDEVASHSIPSSVEEDLYGSVSDLCESKMLVEKMSIRKTLTLLFSFFFMQFNC